jgi:poly-beta-1,6-N-acetyl-D-glucosamine synthase
MPEGARRSYAIVSPVRNEARYIRKTLESVVHQSEPPSLWVIVDDGSTDETPSIVREFSERVGYIRLVRLEDNNAGSPTDRLWWAAEALAFNAGLREVDLQAVDYIVKLDGDLRFSPDYFARIIDEFGRDETLGIAGGYCYVTRKGRRYKEWVPESHVRGPTKVYRVACFSDIGGIEPVYGWDTLDEVHAQMAGWRTRSLPLVVDHLKATGSVNGLVRGQARMGSGAFLLGYHPLFALARGLKTSLSQPYVLSGFAFLAGYLRASVLRYPRVADAATIAYLRQQQMRRLRSAGDLREIRSLLGRGE